MNSLRSLLCLSLLINVALGAGLAHWLWPARARGGVDAVGHAETNVTRPPVSAEPTPAVLLVTNRFHWRELESPDYDVFVANLRAVGCPEKTLRDLVLADLRTAFNAAICTSSPAPPFWTGGRERAQAERARQARTAKLNADYAALAQRLLGVDFQPDADRQPDLTEQALLRFVSGPLPEETFQRFRNVMSQFDGLKKRLNEAEGGVVLPADAAARQALRVDLQRALAATLSPAQLEEFQARVIAIPDSSFALETDALEMTPVEFRALNVLRARHFDPLREAVEAEEPSEAEQSAAEAAFRSEARAWLGESRFADFVRSQDEDYRSLYTALAGEVGRAAVGQAYEISRLARAESDRLDADDALDPAERRQMQVQIRQLTETELRRVLGAKAFQEGGKTVQGLLPEVSK